MVHNPYVEFYFYDGHLHHFANMLALHSKWHTIFCYILDINGDVFELFAHSNNFQIAFEMSVFFFLILKCTFDY